MAKLNYSGALLVVIGAVILVVSIAVLLITVPLFASPFPPTPETQLITTQIQLSWFFIFFASIMIFMGIRRVSPL